MQDREPTVEEFQHMMDATASAGDEPPEFASAFDVAAAAARPTTETAAAAPAFGERPATGKKRGHGRTGNPRGRPPGTSSGPKTPRPSASVVGDVKGPLPPPVAPVVAVKVAPINPAQLEGLLRKVDAKLAERLGMDPLSNNDVREGAEVFAPILDHYAPLLAEKGGIWTAPALWALLAYGPRVYDVVFGDKKAVAQDRAARVAYNRSSEGADPPTAGAAFSPESSVAKSPVVVVEDAPPASTWVNPMEDFPVGTPTAGLP